MIKRIQQKSEKFVKAKGNIMTPLNWCASAFGAVLIPTAAWQHDNWVGIVCMSLAAVILLFYGFVYCYFMIKDPDRLQSEYYKLAQQELLLANGLIEVPSQLSATTLKQVVSENKMLSESNP